MLIKNVELNLLMVIRRVVIDNKLIELKVRPLVFHLSILDEPKEMKGGLKL